MKRKTFLKLTTAAILYHILPLANSQTYKNNPTPTAKALSNYIITAQNTVAHLSESRKRNLRTSFKDKFADLSINEVLVSIPYCIDKDFAEGKTVIANGILISQTEAEFLIEISNT